MSIWMENNFDANLMNVTVNVGARFVVSLTKKVYLEAIKKRLRIW